MEEKMIEPGGDDLPVAVEGIVFFCQMYGTRIERKEFEATSVHLEYAGHMYDGSYHLYRARFPKV